MSAAAELEPEWEETQEEELFLMVLEWVEEWVELNCLRLADPDSDQFWDDLAEEVEELAYETILEPHVLAYVYDTDLIDDAIAFFQVCWGVPRSEPSEEPPPRTQTQVQARQTHLSGLQQLPQPAQRTPEWFAFRHQHLTASNAYKALGSPALRNALIYEKCTPVATTTTTEPKTHVNLTSPMHWGQKYEPVSAQWYQHTFGTVLGEFGCLEHADPRYSFVAASPDGIVINAESGRFGRMVEIKNIVSRDITGIPKKDYWIQMQIQMEVCQLDECDFVETRFLEYDTADAFFQDPRSVKGVMMQLNTPDGYNVVYAYAPWGMQDKTSVVQWEEETLDTYEHQGYTFGQCIYWKLQEVSCVLVRHNRDWCRTALRTLAEVWQVIQTERITGAAHRAPKKHPQRSLHLQHPQQHPQHLQQHLQQHSQQAEWMGRPPE